jgi:Ca2+-binding RTX toxin-like protein
VYVTLDDVANDGVDLGNEGDNVHTDVEDLTTGNGPDIITGSAVANRIVTGEGTNRVDAGDGDDDITGGDSVDRIQGDAGDDRITGRPGNNLLGGGPGDDTFVEGTHWLGNDRFAGGTGDDVVDYSVRVNGLVLDNDGEQGDDGQDIDRNGTSEEKDSIGADIEAIKGGHAGDVMRNVRPAATEWDVCNRLYGGGGNDLLTGSDEHDVLFGGEGHDELHAGGSEDYLVGGPDSDTEYGEGGLDVFVQGGMHADCGGKTFHSIDEPDGADFLIGGGDEDSTQYRRDGGLNVTVRLDGRANDGITGERDNVQTENVSGGSGDDLIVGNDGSNWLHGGDAGNDRIEALGGDDRLGAEDGAAVLVGGDGDDEFDAKDGEDDDTVHGGGGTDTGEWDPGDVLTNVP